MKKFSDKDVRRWRENCCNIMSQAEAGELLGCGRAKIIRYEKEGAVVPAIFMYACYFLALHTGSWSDYYVKDIKIS